ncbi:MAG TPA: hypothetical protein VIG33_14760 [Pseudobdellovibrionaceae bacterium]|jgi:hypothetical protein
MARPVGTRAKITQAALKDMERLGVNPIEMLKAVYDRAITAFDGHRGDTDKSDAGPSYLAVAQQAAANLAKYKHPALSAIAFKDMGESEEDRKPITTEEAMRIIRSDPFAPDEIKEIPNEQVIDAMKSGIQAPLLPGGKNE